MKEEGKSCGNCNVICQHNGDKNFTYSRGFNCPKWQPIVKEGEAPKDTIAKSCESCNKVIAIIDEMIKEKKNDDNYARYGFYGHQIEALTDLKSRIKSELAQ